MGITFLILMACLIVAARVVVLKGFGEIEAQHLRLDVKRVLGEFSNIYLKLGSTAGDWAPWDETYAFVQDRDERYIKENLMPNTLINLNVNFMLFFNNSKRLVYGKFINPASGKNVPVPADLLNRINSTPLLFEHSDSGSSKTGMIMVASTPVFIASRPILKNNFEGPIRGSFITGRYLDANELNTLSDVTRMNIKIGPLNDKNLAIDFLETESSFSEKLKTVVKPLGSDSIGGYAMQSDISGAPIFILKITSPRGIFRQGKITLYYYLFSLLILGTTFISVIIVLLNKFVLSPLSWLNLEVKKIGELDDLLRKIPISGKDEFGNLAAVINNMVDHISENAVKLSENNKALKKEIEYRIEAEEKLKKAYKELKDTQLQVIQSAKLASIGELAASIAHEVNSPLQGIICLMSSIKRGRELDKELIEDLGLLKGGYKRIQGTVKRLLDLSRPGKEIKQSMNVNKVIEDTAALIGGYLKKNRVNIDLNLSSKIPEINASPQQLGQVFLNIFNNAVDAMFGNSKFKEGEQTEESIRREITVSSNLRNDNIIINVSDSGHGISKEDLEPIFDPFYTTKIKLGMGIGLSICRSILEDHNGSIAAKNLPEGGSVFTITLPAI